MPRRSSGREAEGACSDRHHGGTGADPSHPPRLAGPWYGVPHRCLRSKRPRPGATRLPRHRGCPSAPSSVRALRPAEEGEAPRSRAARLAGGAPGSCAARVPSRKRVAHRGPRRGRCSSPRGERPLRRVASRPSTAASEGPSARQATVPAGGRAGLARWRTSPARRGWSAGGGSPCAATLRPRDEAPSCAPSARRRGPNRRCFPLERVRSSVASVPHRRARDRRSEARGRVRARPTPAARSAREWAPSMLPRGRAWASGGVRSHRPPTRAACERGRGLPSEQRRLDRAASAS